MTLDTVGTVAGIVSTAASAFAAAFWYGASSAPKLPPITLDMDKHGFDEFNRILHSTAKLNARGASAAFVAALAAAVVMYADKVSKQVWPWPF